MSGGSMNYVFSHIQYAAEEVASEVKRVEKAPLSDFEAAQYYREKYPECRMFQSPGLMKMGVLIRLRDAYKALLLAEIYARRVEWLTSDDDGYEACVLRTDNELEGWQKLGKPEEGGAK